MLASFGCSKGETSVVGTSSLVFHELCVAPRVLTLDAGKVTRLSPDHAVSGGYFKCLNVTDSGVYIR